MTRSSEGASSEVDISIVMPCLDEAATVAACVSDALSWLQESKTPGEVVVIDNGSSDGSAELAAAAGARVIAEPRRGKGHAVRRGIAETSGEYIVLIDADGTYDLRGLEALVELLRNGYDMVVGNRLRGAIQPGSMPWMHRYLGNPLFSAVISLIAGQRFGDCLSGLRAFRRKAWFAMAPEAAGFELESEMCLRAGRHRLRVAEVPVAYGTRQVRSKLRGLTHGWAIARFIVLDSADIIFFVPALLAIAAGVVSLIIGVVTTEGVEVGSVPWQPVFAGGILIPGGTALITLGLAAKWLAWRRGVAKPDWLIRLLSADPVPIVEVLLLGGCVGLAAGAGLDAYLLWGWTRDTPPPLPLGLGAVAQTLVVTGLNLIVTAMLVGILRVRSTAEAREGEGSVGDPTGNGV
jgi:hypothetical protein